MAVVDEGRAGWTLAAGFAVAAAAALALTPVAWRGPTADRQTLLGRVRLLPATVAERRTLARLDLAAGRPDAARARLATAAQLTPFSAGVRLERAEAALQASRPRESRREARAALRLAPTDAGICEQAALVLLQAGDIDGGRRALRCTLARAPWRSLAVLDLAHAVFADDRLVLRRIVPHDADGVRRFLAWTWARGERDAEALGWAALAAPTPAEVVHHVEFLLVYAGVAPADAAWTAAFGPRDPGGVFDGGFERDVPTGGMGWRLGTVTGARIAVARGDAAASGRRGLEVEFSGGNLAFAHVAQLVPVAAERHYRLTARMRSAGITSLSGPRLRVEGGATCGAFASVDGEELRGTRPWSTVALEFTTPPGCTAVRVLVARPATARLDRELRGRVWLDDVRLE